LLSFFDLDAQLLGNSADGELRIDEIRRELFHDVLDSLGRDSLNYHLTDGS